MSVCDASKLIPSMACYCETVSQHPVTESYTILLEAKAVHTNLEESRLQQSGTIQSDSS